MGVKLTIEVEPDLEQRVRAAAATRNISVKEFVKDSLEHVIELHSLGGTALDAGWLESDLSRLGEVEPYDWAEAELDEGQPLVSAR